MKGTITILLCLISLAFGIKCPSSESIYPCKCGDISEGTHKLKGIECNGKEVKDGTIKKVFQEKNPGPATLLSIHDTAITKIDSGTFDNYEFFEIHITHNEDLEYINPKAFSSTNKHTKYFNLHNNPKFTGEGSGGDIFELIRKFEEPLLVNLSSNAIEKVPDEGLSVSGKKHLTHIDLHGNKIKSIGKNAFLELEAIERIDLNDNQIDHVADHAFSFKSTEDVNIDLSNNKLTSSSFGKDTFESTQAKSVFLNLNKNQLTYLPEESFKSFIKKSNHLTAQDNDFKCDCKMKWLVDMIEKDENGAIDLFCKGQKEQIIALLEEDLEKC